MALFKILRGPSNEFEANLNAADLKPVFKDGYCYFLTGSNMFFVDYEKDNVAYRVPLNAQNAHTLSLTTEDEDGNPLLVEGYTLVDTLTNNDGEISVDILGNGEAMLEVYIDGALDSSQSLKL